MRSSIPDTCNNLLVGFPPHSSALIHSVPAEWSCQLTSCWWIAQAGLHCHPHTLLAQFPWESYLWYFKRSLWAECWWLTLVILVTWEAEIRRIAVWGQPGGGEQFLRPHLQNNQSKMDWRCNSRCRSPALQMWSPESKSQFYNNNKTQSLWGSNKRSILGLGLGSSGRVACIAMKSPEFKL
jgi:hypothetical protein